MKRPTYSVSVLGHNLSEVTRICIDSIISSSDMTDVELVLTDNGSSDDTAAYFAAVDVPHKRVVRHDVNIGFGAGHNYACSQATGPVFVCLNNDMTISDVAWLSKLDAALAEPGVALAGVTGQPSQIRPDGSGIIGDRIDYLDGGLLAGRTALMREAGPFDSLYRMFHFEDSDLSLRLRARGYRLATVEIDHTHGRNTTLKTIPLHDRKRIDEANRAAFRARWADYLRSERLPMRLSLRAPSWGIGDVLQLTSVLVDIKKRMQDVPIHVESLYPDVFIGMNEAASSIRIAKGAKRDVRTVMLSPNYAAPIPLNVMYADMLGFDMKPSPPVIRLSPSEKARVNKLIRPFGGGHGLIVCHFQHHWKNWDGRNYHIRLARDLVRELRNRYAGAYCIVEVGHDVGIAGGAHLSLVGKTSLRDLFAVVERADLVVCIDSLVMHAAQAFGKPCVALFGATNPNARVTVDSVTPVMRPDMNCLGCYQRRGNPDQNICEIRQTGACMEMSVESVMAAISAMKF
jgi:GT2 family glycosyltransferase